MSACGMWNRSESDPGHSNIALFKKIIASISIHIHLYLKYYAYKKIKEKMRLCIICF